MSVALFATCVIAASPPARAAEPTTIYRCAVGDSITFSDRPCDAGAQLYEPDTSRITTYRAPAVAAPARTTSHRRPARNVASASTQAKRAAECARLSADLKAIRSKMRSGYRASEGERLRQRLAALKERVRTSRCP